MELLLLDLESFIHSQTPKYLLGEFDLFTSPTTMFPSTLLRGSRPVAQLLRQVAERQRLSWYLDFTRSDELHHYFERGNF
jgi:hypothetical protein